MELSDLLKNVEVRAAYYEILHQQTLIALELLASSVPSVATGHQRKEDVIEFYLEEAKESYDMHNYLTRIADKEDPPDRLIQWLSDKLDAHNAKTQILPGRNPQDQV